MKLEEHPLYDNLDFFEKAVLESYGLNDVEFDNQEAIEEAVIESLFGNEVD